MVLELTSQAKRWFMKKLTQAVFDLPECPEWAKSAAVDSRGVGFYTSETKDHLSDFRGGFVCTTGGMMAQVIGSGYDTTNWQNSAINRGE